MRKFYICAPVDEIMLAEATRSTVAALAGRLPTSSEIRQLVSEHSLDFATMVLYQSMYASPLHGQYIAEINNEPISTQHERIDAKVLIIPALFFGHYPETGADANLAAGIARNCGFEVGTIPIRSVGTVTENADIIRETLEQESAKNIWIFAVSKGSADFRVFLQRNPEAPSIQRLRGWINVCGLAHGCQIADYNTATYMRSLKYRAICQLYGVGFDLMRELRTDHPYWAEELALPSHMKLFSFSAIPLGGHLQKSIIGRFLAISHLGPNDGMLLCRDSILDQGPAYPVWGADHFFRGPQVIPLLYRFFSYLKRQ
jgi:hypothetical protein